jgi:hypothetical protein
MTNQGNTQAQPEVEPVPTIPNTVQQQENPVMQSNLIDDSPGQLIQEDEVDLEAHDLDEDVIYLFFSHWNFHFLSIEK